MGTNLKSLISKLSPEARSSLEAAAGLCLSRTHYDIGPEHWLLKLLDQSGTDFDHLINSCSLDRARWLSEIQRSLDKLKSGNAKTPALSPLLVDAMVDGWVIASINYDEPQTHTGHVLLAMLTGESARALREGSREFCKIEEARISANYKELVRGSSESLGVKIAEKGPTQQLLSTRFFVSYRRIDSGHLAGRLYDHMVRAFGTERVFMDVAKLQAGELYEIVLADAIARCDAVIAVIGKRWNPKGSREGQRLMDDPSDWVRMELEIAVRHSKRIIPCLIDGARAPKSSNLPNTLTEVIARHAFELTQSHFDRDVADFLDALRKIQPASTTNQQNEAGDRTVVT